MVDIGEEFLACGHRFEDAAFVFFPSSAPTSQRAATKFTRLSDRCVLRQSTTNTHSASGSVSTVRVMWATNSGSVRVCSRVGQTIFPVTTSRPVGRVLLVDELVCRSEEHTSELQSLRHLVCRLL